MSAERLQAAIRRTKTPVALVLDPREDRLEKKYLKNFTDLYGDCPMAHAEALRYHGSQSISQAAGKLPAVMLRAEPYLRQGFMGMDVLSNLVNMAKNQGLYTIVDARCAGTEPWLRGGINADAVTILPYGGAESCRVATSWSSPCCAPGRPGWPPCRILWPGTGRCFRRLGSRWPASALPAW